MYTLEKPTEMNKSEKRQQQQQRNDIVYMWVLRRSQAQNRKTAANKESECVNEWADKKYQKWKYTLSLAQTHTHTRNAAHNTLTYISVNFVCLFVFFSLPFFPIPLHSSFFCWLCFIGAFHEHMFFPVSSILMPIPHCIWLFSPPALQCAWARYQAHSSFALSISSSPPFFFALSQNTIIL